MILFPEIHQITYIFLAFRRSHQKTSRISKEFRTLQTNEDQI